MNESSRLATATPEQSREAASDDATTIGTLPYAQVELECRVLVFDALRERADDLIAHERQGMPPLLDIDCELLGDTCQFDRPANCALLPITRVGDNWVDEANQTVITIDPCGIRIDRSCGFLDVTSRVAPLRRDIPVDEAGRDALRFASDHPSGITGMALHDEAGVHVRSPLPAAKRNAKSEDLR